MLVLCNVLIEGMIIRSLPEKSSISSSDTGQMNTSTQSPTPSTAKRKMLRVMLHHRTRKEEEEGGEVNTSRSRVLHVLRSACAATTVTNRYTVSRTVPWTLCFLPHRKLSLEPEVKISIRSMPRLGACLRLASHTGHPSGAKTSIGSGVVRRGGTDQIVMRLESGLGGLFGKDTEEFCKLRVMEGMD